MSIIIGSAIILVAVAMNLLLFRAARAAIGRARREGRLHRGWQRRERDDQAR